MPLDRRHNDGRKASIDFKLFVHTESGPAVSTVWWNGGGPGPSTTRNEPGSRATCSATCWARSTCCLPTCAARGRLRRSARSSSPSRATTPGAANHGPIAACAASIADRIDTYGSADSARDLEALRAALGIPKLDLIGNSYGAMPATAYALRFPQRTRSLIISSGVDVEATLS